MGAPRFLLPALLALILPPHGPYVKSQGMTDHSRFKHEQFLENVNYDKWTRPGNKTSPLKINVRMYIYFLGSIEAQNLQFTAHALIRYRWKDERLAHQQVLIEGEGPLLLNKIWTPHIYIVNEQNSKVMSSGQDILITIDNDGTVSYSTRLQITLLCLMNLKKFPFDYQLCPFVLESWGYNSSDISLDWEETSPVTINKELELTEYTLADKWTHKNNNTYIIPGIHKVNNITYSKFYGNYSSLTVTFRFEREIGHYIMDYYVPSMLLVVVSWVSFWLDPNAVPGRTTLGTSTMLTFITLSRNIGASLPKVSYIKATEIWFIVCTGFIFGSLVEFAFVNTIWRRRTNVELKKVSSRYILKSTLTPQPKRRDISSLSTSHSFLSQDFSKASTSSLNKFNSNLSVSSFHTISKDPFPFSSHQSDLNDSKSTAQKGFFTMTPQEIAQWIDRKSRILFPCGFLLFITLYWSFVYIEF